MLGKYICLNGKLIDNKNAKIDIDNIEFSYGFGVYENIRLRNDRVFFLSEHLNRLLNSARVIGLVHDFNIGLIGEWVDNLIRKNKIESANIKMLLIGGGEPKLYIMFLAPIYPDKKIYRDGVKVMTYNYVRFLPEAKTLNMLPSYLAYSEGRRQGAYDTLFIDKKGCIAEGTRTNFFAIKNKILYTAPVGKVLDGVTRRTVIDCALENGFKIIEKDIKLEGISKFDGAFLTSTSGKIVPIKTIHSSQFGVHNFGIICEEIKKLIIFYNDYLNKVDVGSSDYK